MACVARDAISVVSFEHIYFILFIILLFLTNAVLRAGGEPAIVVPQQLTDEDADELMSRFDGLVLMGANKLQHIGRREQRRRHSAAL